MAGLLVEACERGLMPDRIIRAGMRRRIANRIASRLAHDPEHRSAQLRAFIERASTGPITPHSTAKAGHHELPAAFFSRVLGAHMKYSGCLFEPGIDNLNQAEHAMLALYAERARLRDGLKILDLGCGWGAFALWAAKRYPRASIHAVAEAEVQRQYLSAVATERGLDNLTVATGDINGFDPGAAVFDRIVSVEVFEHLRNYRALFARIARWLRPDGRLFAHVFAHPQFAYTLADNDGLARHFFTGIMPSENLFARFQNDLVLRDAWWLSGTHYRDTAQAWLARLDTARDPIERLFADTYGPADARRWVQRLRLFFMAIAELFGYRQGHEWGIAHYLFGPR